MFASFTTVGKILFTALVMVGGHGSSTAPFVVPSHVATTTAKVQVVTPAVKTTPKKVTPAVKAPTKATTITVTPVNDPPTITKSPTVDTSLSNDNYYTNVNGNSVHSPAYGDEVPAGASAQCRDGTYSFSQNRRGTCSGHGGVSSWL